MPRPSALALVALGALPALASVKMQLFSLALFPLVLLLLRADHDRPSRRIWWVVLVIAVWGNLHGAVLLGVAVTGATCSSPGFVAARPRPSPWGWPPFSPSR